MKIVIYTTGHRFILNGANLGLHAGQITKEYDLKMATPEEIKSLEQNPDNDYLLAEIEKRG